MIPSPPSPTVFPYTTLFRSHPERLLEFMKYFIVFDNNVKKIARYQQYFGVKEIIKRVEERDENGNRKSGVIWHTQGSGKSLTMVMFAKYVFSALHTSHPKVVVVTDRVDLDNQIYKTFQHTQLRPNQASTGRHLVELINDNAADIITRSEEHTSELQSRGH